MTGLRQLERHEGKRNKMYRDSLGIETIGVGHNLRDKAISDRAVEVIFDDDVNDVLRDLSREFPGYEELNEPRRWVLINMAFNMGVKGLLDFKNTLEAIKDGKWG